MALFLIDMDGFKEINDTLGHAVGDATLVEIAARLEHEFSSNADVSRLGGDEFCVACEDISHASDASALAMHMQDILTQRYVLPEAEFTLGASIGFAFCPDHAADDIKLLAFADTAMYHAKENILGHACYEPKMTDRLLEHRQMQERLTYALERDEFHLVYQPQVDLRTGTVIGVEALLRWRHDGGQTAPDEFIPLLEQSREIIHVGKWVIREACRQLAAWATKGHAVEMAINVSAVQFKDPNFNNTINEAIRDFDVDPAKLDFEITEGLLIDDVDEAIEKLSRLKEIGATISIDDFGTGYSSLAYLQQFPIDRLKIDRAFIKDIPDHDTGVIASSIVVLAKALGLKVLAEGAETLAQIEFLKANDCDEYQGYFLCPPLPAEEVVNQFETQPPSRVLPKEIGKANMKRFHEF